jgi:hypothetical protein
LNAEWAYKNGGATSNRQAILTVQGRSDDAIVLRDLRLIDVKFDDPPADLSEVIPCDGAFQEIQPPYYQVIMLPGSDGNGGGGLRQIPGLDKDGRTTEPVKQFPFEVTNSHIEYFRLDLGSIGAPCICSWRMALDWTSSKGAGSTIIDHRFGSFRTFAGPGWNGQGKRKVHSYFRDGSGHWDPPLPT